MPNTPNEQEPGTVGPVDDSKEAGQPLDFSTPTATQPNPPPVEDYASYCSSIDTAGVQRILVGANSWQGRRATRVHLLFQSPGGLVGDGVFLYNYFRAVPFDLYLYNVGQVSSIGTIAFLGGHRRIASAHASFMIHRSTFIPNMSTAARLQAIGRGLTVDDQRTEAILREHVRLEPQQWDELHHHDLILSAPEALKCGLVHEISEVVVPRGSIVISLQGAFHP